MIVDIVWGYHVVIASAGWAMVGISSWERPELDFNNSRLFSNIWEDYIGPAFELRYPAYQNMFGQNILWYLLRVMRCDKNSRLRISICTLPCNYTHLSIWYQRLRSIWLIERSERGRLPCWKAWTHQWLKALDLGATNTMVESMGHHDAAACGTHERERGRGEHICRRSSCCQMVPPMISTIESGQSGTHHWDWECYAFICVVFLNFAVSPSTFRF